MRELITLHVNGERHELAVLPHHTLLEVLREDMGLIGTKHGCELGECGACTVLIDGASVLSCLTLPIEVQENEITTIEGLEINGKLHPLQETFAELGAAQCGYCTPGMLLSGVALLQAHPQPTREQIKECLAGNLCRCTGYTKIYEAVEAAAERINRGSKVDVEPTTGNVDITGELDVLAGKGPGYQARRATIKAHPYGLEGHAPKNLPVNAPHPAGAINRAPTLRSTAPPHPAGAINRAPTDSAGGAS